jgi:hypothetical protein
LVHYYLVEGEVDGNLWYYDIKQFIQYWHDQNQLWKQSATYKYWS